MNYRTANLNDCPLLAELNRQLIQDEGHRNPMSLSELERRMKEWLSEDYAAVLFEDGGEVVAYALFREQADEVYLRHLFVIRSKRRKGIGRKAMQILRSRIWPMDKRLTVSVLISNQTAIDFWRAVGYRDYSMTLEILPEMKRPRNA
jgi:predicted acetyltransferase